jgi:cell cycle checkpoint protein
MVESSQSAEIDNVAFEIPLNTVIECLNIFGSAGISSSAGGSYKKWKKTEDGSENEDGADDGRQRQNGTRPTRGIESYFGGGSEKRTGMRLSYAGPGYPLTLIL